MLYTDCSVVDIECLCCPRRTPCSTLQRFAPFADCSALDTWPSAPYLDCSLPGVSRPVLFSARSFRFAPCSALSASASALDCSSLVAALLAPVANCFALDTWPSASRSDCSSLDASRPRCPRIAPLVHRLTLAPGTNCFVLDTWPSASRPALSLRIAPCSLLPALRCLRIAPRSTLSTNCLAQTSPRSTLSARTVP